MNYQQIARDELSEILSEEHALNFMKEFGGNRVYVPKISAQKRIPASPTSIS
jgi:hypothetical protein